MMMNHTNTGYNSSIKCSVDDCVYHCDSKEYCSLNEIKVGTCKTNATTSDCTECVSFAPGSKK